MNISVPTIAVGIVILVAGLTNLVTAAPDPFDKLELRATLKSDKVEIQALAFSPDGKILASTERDGIIHLWDTVNGKSLHILKGHPKDPDNPRSGNVLAVAFSPDGKTLASSSDDRTIRLWDLSTAECTSVLKTQGSFQSILFSLDGKSVVLQGSYLLDLKTEKKQILLDDVIRGLRRNTRAQCYDAKGQLLVACVVSLDNNEQYNTIMVWNSSEGKETLTLKGHTKDILQVVFRSDGTLVASADRDKTIHIWDLTTGKSVATFENQPDITHALAFSPDGKILACGGSRARCDCCAFRTAKSWRHWRVTSGRLAISRLAPMDGCSPVTMAATSNCGPSPPNCLMPRTSDCGDCDCPRGSLPRCLSTIAKDCRPRKEITQV